jgi:HK97 family phage major capsid protein
VPPVQEEHVRWTAGGQYLESEARDARANVGRRRSLKPNKRELVVQIAVRDSLLRGVACSPEVATALKEDIARALVNEADAAFLHGGGGALPFGITFPGNGHVPTGDLLADARAMIAGLRNGPRVRFDNPGWVIGVRTLDALTKLRTDHYLTEAPGGARTLDSTRLLMLDGDDSGALLGYPFVATMAAQEGDESRMYFSADWSEAWIGVDQDLVTVAISTETEFKTDQTLLRAVMHHDFVVRTPNLFAYTGRF